MVVRRLGELEAEIMSRLWAWDHAATVREVVDDLNEQRTSRPAAYTTVNTVTAILFHKGLVLREGKSGRAWLYRAAGTREAYTAALMQEALGDAVNPATTLALFVEQISAEEAEALRAALRGLREKTP